MTFQERWDWITKRRNVVQQREELEYIYNIMKDCDFASYLEVGTAEGDSLYVLGPLAKTIHYVDYGEAHTKPMREEVLKHLNNPYVFSHLGDSTSAEIANSVVGRFDCVLIDGGHDFATVLSDCIIYGTKATKYIFFHDVQLPEVKAAVEWFVKHWGDGEYSTFINSPSYGYGVLKCSQPP